MNSSLISARRPDIPAESPMDDACDATVTEKGRGCQTGRRRQVWRLNSTLCNYKLHCVLVHNYRLPTREIRALLVGHRDKRNPMRSLKIALLCAGIAWACLTRPALAQVPPHAPGTICFTPTFWCWAYPPGPPGYPCSCYSPGGWVGGVLG